MSIPSLQGEIRINTRSVDQAVKEVEQLGATVRRFAQTTGQNLGSVGQELSRQVSQYQRLSKAVGEQAQAQNRADSIIARAANTVSNFQQSIERSNMSQQQQAAILTRSATELRAYEVAVRSGTTGGEGLRNINTQLNVSLGQLKREATETADAQRQLQQAQEASSRVGSQASQQMERLTSAIRVSHMEEARKVELSGQATQAQQRLNQVLQSSTSTTQQITQAQRTFREELNKVQVSVREVNSQFKSAEARKFADEFRNLTSSTVLALGPLSGVGSRLIALQGLFQRNAASLAVFFAGVTAFSVGLNKSFEASMEAERQFLQLDAQITSLGGSASFTADEIMHMGRALADATLLSAQEARGAASSLLEFGNISRSQFEDVILSAQGMTAVLGGALPQRLKLLGRAIDDPLSGLDRLRQAGVSLSAQARREIQDLTMQGRGYEATSRILQEFTQFKEAATNQAKGMSGAIDAVGDSLQVLYETLIDSTGLLDTTAGSVSEVATNIREFAESPWAGVIANLFEKITTSVSSIGSAVSSNFQVLIGAFVMISATYIPRLIVAITSLGSSMAVAVIPSRALRDSLIQNTQAAAAKTVALQRLQRVMGLVSPIAAAVTALGLLYTAYKRAQAAQDEFSGRSVDKVTQAYETIRARVARQTELITADLAVAVDDRLRLQQEEHSQLVSQADAAAERRQEIEDELYKNLSSGQSQFLRNAVEQGRSTEDLIRIYGYFSDSVKATNWENLVRQYAAVGGEAKELEKDIESLSETLRELEKMDAPQLAETLGLDAASQRFLGMQANIRNLGEEWLKADREADNLRKTITVLEGQIAFMTQHTDADWFDAKTLKDAERILALMQERLASMGGEGGEGVSRQFTRWRDTIRDLNEQVQIAELRARGAFDEANLGEFEHSVRRTSEAFQELGDKSTSELDAIAKKLGMESGSSAEDIARQYEMQRKTLQSLNEEIERKAENDRFVIEALKEQHTGTGQAVQDYIQLGEAIRGSSMSLEQQEAAYIKAADTLSGAFVKAHEDARAIASQPFSDLATLDAEFEQRAEMIREKFDNEKAQFQQHLDTLEQQAKASKAFLIFQETMNAGQQLLGQSMQLMSALGKEQTKDYQRIALAQATMAQAVAVAKAFQEFGPVVGVGMAALAGATVGAQIRAINTASYATGGYVSGAGTSTSDSIPARLSDGEYVINAAAVRKLGIPSLDMLNQGQVPKFRTGGAVGGSIMPSKPSFGSGDMNVQVTIIDQSTGSKDYSTEESVDPSGQRQIRIMVRDAVKDAMRSGELDVDMQRNYGQQRRPVRR